MRILHYSSRSRDFSLKLLLISPELRSNLRIFLFQFKSSTSTPRSSTSTWQISSSQPCCPTTITHGPINDLPRNSLHSQLGIVSFQPGNSTVAQIAVPRSKNLSSCTVCSYRYVSGIQLQLAIPDQSVAVFLVATSLINHVLIHHTFNGWWHGPKFMSPAHVRQWCRPAMQCPEVAGGMKLARRCQNLSSVSRRFWNLSSDMDGGDHVSGCFPNSVQFSSVIITFKISLLRRINYLVCHRMVQESSRNLWLYPFCQSLSEIQQLTNLIWYFAACCTFDQ